MINVFKQYNSMVVDKRIITDNRLSFLAKGIYVYLLTDPNENEILHRAQIDAIFNEGLKELVAFNLVQMPNERFKPFDYYQERLGLSIKTKDRDALITYIKNVNPLLLKEAIDRTATKPRNSPFGYLKHILDDWIAKGYSTLDDVYASDQEHIETIKVNTKQKGEEKHAELGRKLSEQGHFKGVADDGSW